MSSIAIIVLRTNKNISEQEVRNLLPPDKLFKNGLELEKITILET